MQVLRQAVTKTIQQPIGFARLTGIFEQVRFDGSDPKSSTSSEKHKSSNLNKTKSGGKKQKSTETDDTNQPGATRKDWNRPDQVISNDPQYGKGGSPKKS